MRLVHFVEKLNGKHCIAVPEAKCGHACRKSADGIDAMILEENKRCPGEAGFLLHGGAEAFTSLYCSFGAERWFDKVIEMLPRQSKSDFYHVANRP
jgi:hypothetical protein